MKVNIELNGKTAELDIPDEKLVELGLVEEKKPTGYERVPHGRNYYYTGSTDEINKFTEEGSYLDDRCYSIGNYYSNEEVAEANARADKLMRRLRRFAAENGGIPSAEDWKDGEKDKWFISFRYSDGGCFSTRHTFIRGVGIVHFNSVKACAKAIEEFKDELTWYFTEYQAMLY